MLLASVIMLSLSDERFAPTVAVTVGGVWTAPLQTGVTCVTNGHGGSTPDTHKCRGTFQKLRGLAVTSLILIAEVTWEFSSRQDATRCPQLAHQFLYNIDHGVWNRSALQSRFAVSARSGYQKLLVHLSDFVIRKPTASTPTLPKATHISAASTHNWGQNSHPILHMYRRIMKLRRSCALSLKNAHSYLACCATDISMHGVETQPAGENHAACRVESTHPLTDIFCSCCC